MENETVPQLKSKQLPVTQLSSESGLYSNVAAETGIGFEAFKRFLKGGASGLLAGVFLQPL